MDYSKLKYSKLKKMCKDRNLDSKGTKIDLITRLDIYNGKLVTTKDNELILFVRTLMGAIYTINIDENKTFQDLKRLVSYKRDIPMRGITLMYYAYQIDDNDESHATLVKLDENKTLKEQGVINETTFELTVKL